MTPDPAAETAAAEYLAGLTVLMLERAWDEMAVVTAGPLAGDDTLHVRACVVRKNDEHPDYVRPCVKIIGPARMDPIRVIDPDADPMPHAKTAMRIAVAAAVCVNDLYGRKDK